MTKKVCIVGFAVTTRKQTPWDEDYEFWGCNEGYVQEFPKIDRWFQIHPYISFSRADNTNDPKHFEWLMKEHPFEIYMQEKFPFIPSSEKYPLEIYAQWYGRKYFRSSFDYMMAMAIMEGYEEIGIFGFEMASNTEYCLDKSMRVLTADLRWTPIGDMNVGDEIIAFDEHPKPNSFRRWRLATIEAIGKIYRPSVKITLSDGTELICSKEHRWLTGNENKHEWRESQKLTPQYGRKFRGGHPTRLLKVSDMWEEKTGYDAGYVAGVFDGEGSLSQIKRAECKSFYNRLQYGQRDNELLEHTNKILEADGFNIQNYGDLNYTVGGGVREVMRFLGMYRPKRLLPKFNPDYLGVFTAKDYPQVVTIEDIGWQEVIQFKTSTGTCVIEGIASHNSHQRPSAEYWIGRAEGMGIKIREPRGWNLLRGSLYGFEDNSVGFRQQLEMRAAFINKKSKDEEQKFYKLNGACEELDRLVKLASDPENTGFDPARDFNERQNDMVKQSALMNVYLGAKQEVENMIRIFDDHSGIKSVLGVEEEQDAEKKES